MSDKDLTQEEKEKVWEHWVRSEVLGLLDTYLSKSANANVNVAYSYPVKEVFEDGSVMVDKNKATGVRVIIQFEFDDEVDITKPVE